MDINKILAALNLTRFENAQNPLEQRMFVGKIIIAVLTERISVKRALLLFPKDAEDLSVQAAWHALCHFEADEDIKRKNPDYEQEQLEYLEFIAFTFKDGKELPENIIASYKKFHQETLLPHKSNIFGVIKKLFKSINV